MPLYTLIEDSSGEQMLVLDTKGHQGFRILEEGVTAPKVPGCERKDGKWRVTDKEATRLAHIQSQSRAILARRLFDLEARLAKAGL